MTKYRILIVDDNPTVRNAIAIIFKTEPDFEVCGEAYNVEGAIEQCNALQPDLALIDISLKGEDGLDLARHLRDGTHAVRTVVLSLHDDEHHINRAREAGCHGYAVKGRGPDELLACMRSVLAGQEYFACPEQP